MKKRIDNWLIKHLVGVCLISIFILSTFGVYYISRCARGLFGGVDYVFCTIDVVVTVLYLILLVLTIRKKQFEKFVNALSEEAKKLYFHGFRLNRYVNTCAFWRFQEWLGSGRCYAFSVLAMIMLRPNKTATLYRGDSYGKDGQLKTRHSWVEFKIPMNGWWVADFSWTNHGFMPKKEFFKAVNVDSERLEPKWSCSYDEFWGTPFVGAICEAMEDATTSNIFRKLAAFGNPGDEDYGFTEYCYSEEMLKYAICKQMIPYYDTSDEKFISSRIIRDFVKNPKREQPKARSIRLTRLVVHRYEKLKAEQEKTAPT